MAYMMNETEALKMTELRFTLADCILIDLELEDYDQLMTKDDIAELEAWLQAQEERYCMDMYPEDF